MSLFKPSASLSGGLLVRKGGAMPASLVFATPEGAPVPRIGARLVPPRPEHPRLQPSHPEPVRAEAPRPAAADGKPARAQRNSGRPPRRPGGAKVSLRLDPDRHQRLRIAALHQQRSGQQLLLAALDAYLERSALTVLDGGCACLQRRPG